MAVESRTAQSTTRDHALAWETHAVVCRVADSKLCGGEVDPGSAVDEKWLIDLERRNFVELAKMPKTQDRIRYMLANGKPLRN